VRFGNVMGSRGSVVPLFQKQIRRGGPITVTHPDIVRFFMTISEAVQLVLCAGSLAHKGEVFVLDMGNPRKILDLAHEMVRLSGLEPGKDIEITITGLRSGEKMREELWEVTEKVFATRFEKLAIVQSESCKREDIFNWASCLARAARENDSAGIYEILSRAGIGFSRAEGGAKGAAAS
jgi:FlaA1/EpsC-like NDP-sugar epimerase